MGRKDRERFRRLREINPDYSGYRGLNALAIPPPPSETETDTVVCSVCQRKRNVPTNDLPDDLSTFVCLRCQDDPN